MAALWPPPLSPPSRSATPPPISPPPAAWPARISSSTSRTRSRRARWWSISIPAAYTSGCDLQAHTFAEESDKFTKAGATIIGVSADDLGRLHKFSADPQFCAGKFPIASDESTKIAQTYDLSVRPPREGAKDVNQADINHAFIERVTFVIGKDGKILATLSSATDKLSPDQHVHKSLEIVSAAK